MSSRPNHIQFDCPYSKLILGPPGTGKTATLMDILDKELANGTPARRIMFISFTRRAIEEVISRVKERFEIDPDDLQWFRTIHSLCYKQLSMMREEVFTEKHAQEVCVVLKTEYTMGAASDWAESLFEQAAPGNLMFQVDHLARTSALTLRQAWEAVAPDDVSFEEQERFSAFLKEYKTVNMLSDFTDMLERFETEGWLPELDVVIVDEAQDLSTLQWNVLFQIASHTKKMYLAGDDDQSIYQWAGADVDIFLSLKPTETQVLDHSYRLPRRVYQVTQFVAGHIKDKYEKRWGPTERDGNVGFVDNIDQLPLERGSWLILARAHHHLSSVGRQLFRLGYLYTTKDYVDKDGYSKHPVARAAVAWHRLTQGEFVPAADIKCLARLVMTHASGIPKGYKGKLNQLDDNVKLDHWQLREEFNMGLDINMFFHQLPFRLNLSPSQRSTIDYMRRCQNQCERFDQPPRIYLSTIHSMKGAEADNVAVFNAMTSATMRNFDNNPDQEHRLFYVAVTRARQRLWIVDTRARFKYPPFEVLRQHFKKIVT